MIELTETISSDDYLRVPLTFKSGRVQIEFASNRALDVAVLNVNEFNAFATQNNAEDDQQWFESVRQKDFVFEIPDSQKYVFVLWNCNSNKTAVAAYKFTLL